MRSRVNEIDLVRFFAALSVVFFHYTFRGYAADDMSIMPYELLAPISKYGYLGVPLFFMISGFVILMTASSGSLKKFTISRIVRLYPAFLVCCTVTFVATLLIGGAYYSASLSQYLINMTMFSGFVGVPSIVPSIDGVYWSLFVEIKFYALIALILLFRQIHRVQSFLILWLGITVTLEALSDSTLNSLFAVSYSAYFIAGAMFYLIYVEGFTTTRVIAIVGAWVVAIYQSWYGSRSVLSLPFQEQHYSTDFNYYVVAGIISAFFVLMFLISIRHTGFIGNRTWVAIGGLTYPLYLIHQNIGFMVFNLAYPAVNRHILLLVTIFIMIVFAYLVNQKVERRYSKSLQHVLELSFTTTSNRLTRRGKLGQPCAGEIEEVQEGSY